MRGMCTHLNHARQIDKGKNTDPDNVQKVPEKAEARQAPQVLLGQIGFADHLDAEHHHPQEAAGYVQPVRADQREER